MGNAGAALRALAPEPVTGIVFAVSTWLRFMHLHSAACAALIPGILLASSCTLLPRSHPSMTALPQTRAERTGYTETSHYEDVIGFLDSLQKLGAPLYRDSIGHTTEGRTLPLVVLSRPLVRTPAEAHRLNRPIVYVQANIHAGEVEGKEAMLAMIRDLAFHAGPGVLDSIVLMVVPIYNADGNERFASQEKNRTEQNGPELVGTRANAQGLDLNRDYVKAEAPETRASLAAFNAWDPNVFVDLHTTDGSFHGYALTYSPSLDPAALFTGPFTRDSLLPELRRRVRERHGFEIFDYGNFSQDFKEDLADSVKHGWYTYDSRPRFGTNYYGLRNRIAILSEAYSHDPFERRIKATYAFVQEILSLVAEQGATIRALEQRADASVALWAAKPDAAPPIPLRSELTRNPRTEPVSAEVLEHTGDSSRTQPGVPRGFRRTGRFFTADMPVYDRFVPTLERKLPAGYVVPAGDTAVLRLLELHGVKVQHLSRSWTTTVERFTLDSIAVAPRPFQGHHEVTLNGRWNRERTTIPAGAMYVSASQPLALVAFHLLEPESDDGLATWNLFDNELSPGAPFPILRCTEPLSLIL